jgi:hypothetical protein
MWRDLTSEPVWKYEELPPLLLVELTKLDLFEVGDSELARASGFGRAGASSPFMRETSLAIRVAEMIISLLAVVAVIYLMRSGSDL